MGEEWLNGWPRLGPWQVLVGNGVHCIGCGKCYGITTIAIDENYEPPEKLPVWAVCGRRLSSVFSFSEDSTRD